MWQLTSRGYGQSTCVGIGGDPVTGTSHLDVLQMFNDDPATEAIIMIGEIGGGSQVFILLLAPLTMLVANSTLDP